MTRFLTLILACLIAVTSQQMASARGLMVTDGGQVILCTGAGTITVTLDADGNIVDTPEVAHICPDCALTFADATSGPHWSVGALIHMQTLVHLPDAETPSPVIHTETQPRGPPLSV